MDRNSLYSGEASIFFFLFLFTFFCQNAAEVTSTNKLVTDIGVIIDVGSRIGKEEKTAMEVAVRNFNNNSKNNMLSLHFRHPGGDPLQASYAAEELIKEKKVKVIAGMETWEEAALVADIGRRAQVPILSFSNPAITPPLASIRWPYLVRMGSNGTEEMRCIAALVHSYSWRRVIVIYEDNALGGESGNLALLSKALQDIGSEIEYRLVLPPGSLLSNPKETVRDELVKLVTETKSRIFIVLDSSLSMLTCLFREAKNMGLVGRDTAWIVASTITNLIDTFDPSVIFSMEGSLGIKTYYSADSDYRNLRSQFRKIFLSEYPDEDDFHPGIHALKAYDSISTIAKSVERLNGNMSSPKMLLETVLASNFTGLSGQIRFETGMLLNGPTYRIVNVVGKKYKELDFWLPGFGFSTELTAENVTEKVGEFARGLTGPVIWPGDLKEQDPKGWAMPTASKKLRIVVPMRTSFEKFVTFPAAKREPEGFCIDLFYKVLEKMHYPVPHDFFRHEGSYDALVESVYNKTYDVAVGDITILAERTRKVEFTQPYLESGLSMIVPIKPQESTWLFVKPFNLAMWITTGAIFLYTMLVIWFIEIQSDPPNPEFTGLWKQQISTAFWFTFSSLFFAHKEKIYSSLAQVVVMVWLCVVFVITASYTASLTSMLTVQRMEPDFSHFENLRSLKSNVGCDNDSFIENYLENVLKFGKEQIKIMSNENDYPKAFKSNNISAAFLEFPYQKVFLNNHCKQFSTTREGVYRFGGFGFAFQKGSPIAEDFSRAILDLSERGEIKPLEDKWFAQSSECSGSTTDNSIGSLTLDSLLGLYIVSGVTTTICLVLCLIRMVRNQKSNLDQEDPNLSNSVRKRVVEIVSYIQNNHIEKSPTARRATSFPKPAILDAGGGSSSLWESVSTSDDTKENHDQALSPTAIEML